MQTYNHVLDWFLETYCDRVATWQQMVAITSLVLGITIAWLHSASDHAADSAYADVESAIDEIMLQDNGPLITNNF